MCTSWSAIITKKMKGTESANIMFQMRRSRLPGIKLLHSLTFQFQVFYSRPFHLALNAGFIALTWACVQHAVSYLLQTSWISDCRTERATRKAKSNKKEDPEELIVHVSRARIFATPSYAIRGSNAYIGMLAKTTGYLRRNTEEKGLKTT